MLLMDSMVSETKSLGLLEGLKYALDLSFHPSHANRNMKIEESFIFFYKYSAIPVLLSVMLWAIGGRASIAGYVIFGWIITPLFILATTFVVHVIGKFILRRFKNGFDETFTANVYGAAPGLIFVWLGTAIFVFTNALGISLVYALLIFIWGFIVDVYALSLQQNASKLSAFVSAGIPVFFTGVIAGVAAFLLYGLYVNSGLNIGGSLFSTSFCIGSRNFSCSNMTITNTSKLAALVSQSSGQNEYNLRLYCLITNQSRRQRYTTHYNVTNASAPGLFGYKFTNITSVLGSGQQLKFSGLQCYNFTGGIQRLQHGIPVGGILIANYTLGSGASGFSNPWQTGTALFVANVT